MTRRPDGAFENDVLRVLWAADGPLLPGEINERLDVGYAYTSVATILTRLQAKGWVVRTPAGRAFAYEPGHSNQSSARHIHRTQRQAMTVSSQAFPLLVTLVLAAIATSAHRRLPPRLATRFVTIALVLVVLAAVPTALVVAITFLAHAPVIGFGFKWCAQAIGLHGSVSPWVGVPIVVLIGSGTVRTFRLLRQHRELRLDEAHPIHIAHSHKPYAVTLPGRAGQIVISTAMVDLLDEDEKRIVVAHEQAHARYRRDRYLLTAGLTRPQQLYAATANSWRSHSARSRCRRTLRPLQGFRDSGSRREWVRCWRPRCPTHDVRNSWRCGRASPSLLASASTNFITWNAC